MKRDEILKIFKKLNVLLKGHFLLTSGFHSARYLQCAGIFQYPEISEKFARALVEKFKDIKIDVVASPAIGGIILGYEVARALGVKAIFSEREENQMKFRRGFKINRGERVLIVEDVITTGGSVREVKELIEKEGGKPVGIGTIVDRSDKKLDFDLPFKSLIKLKIKKYEPSNCQLCKKGIPLIKPGSRKIK
jgi:orotate phosphoribosyltransferase